MVDLQLFFFFLSLHFKCHFINYDIYKDLSSTTKHIQFRKCYHTYMKDVFKLVRKKERSYKMNKLNVVAYRTVLNTNKYCTPYNTFVHFKLLLYGVLREHTSGKHKQWHIQHLGGHPGIIPFINTNSPVAQHHHHFTSQFS